MDTLQVRTEVSGGRRSRSASPSRFTSLTVVPPTGRQGKRASEASVTGLGGSSRSSGGSARRRSPHVSKTEGTPPQTNRVKGMTQQGSQEDTAAGSSAEDVEDPYCVDATGDLSCGDDIDGLTSDATRTREAMEHIQNKIYKIKEQIKREQKIRDENVNEYLTLTVKLAANTADDKHQLQRLKTVFEKKNQKAATQMAHLQKKLESYTKKSKELETSGVVHRQPKEVLRGVGQGLKNVGGNIRDGITGFSGGVVGNIKGGLHGAAESVMSKPREIAHLIKNKFGSADNISNLSKHEDSYSDEAKAHHGSATLPAGVPGPNSSGVTPPTTHGPPQSSKSEEGAEGEVGASECSSVTSESGLGVHATHLSSPRHPTSQIPLSGEGLLGELSERREECERLREEIDTIKQTLQQEISFLSQTVQEERFRYDRLEEQMNDFIELHQNEVENLRQAMVDMEEKVQYQSEERLRDMNEMMDKCNTRIARMEHQQAEHQQLVNIEGIENSHARALIVKLVNIVLTVLQVVLLVVATAASILTPFLKNRLRILTTTLLIGAIIIVTRQWTEFTEFISSLFRHYKKIQTR